MIKKWLRVFTRLLLAGIGLYFFAALLLMLAGLKETLAPADVGVVFGNKVEPWGEPSPSLASRLDKALTLYQQGYYPRLIVSGGLGKEGWDEAQVMADYLVARGVPREAILVDSQGNNTYLTALHTAELGEQYGFRSYLLVSHFYHLPRARLIFNRLGLKTAGAGYAARFVARDFYFGLLREVIAYPAYLLYSYQ
jgi:uncharacterized SAM-binding protein YcdF (DUF218 family)